MPRKKAANGDGNVRQLKNGTWQVRLIVGRDPCTGKLIPQYKTFPTKQEADKWKRATASKIDGGTYVKPSNYTLNKWLDIWLETYTTHLRNIAMYRSNIKNYLRHYLGGGKAAELTPTNILMAYDRIRKDYEKKHGKPISEKTMKNIHSMLSAVMSAFVDDGGRADNPCDRVTSKMPKVKKPDLPQLDEQEIGSLLAAMEVHPFENLYRLDLLTGMRQGEILGLKWSDVDFDKQRITVRGQLRKPVEKGQQYAFTVPKNGKTRTIFPPVAAFDVLRNEKKRQIENEVLPVK